MLGGLSRHRYAARTLVGLPNFEDRAKSYVGKLVAGNYRLESLLGLGGMSAVFRASDPEGKSLAVKLLYPELLDSEAAVRFERESQIVVGLSHPHVAATVAAGHDDALGHYLVMPLLSGRDLNGVLERHGALAPENAVRVALQAARGLAAAHRIGVVHRAVKPGNLLLERDGPQVIVEVCDFGMPAGGQLGAPDYAAPEQLKHDKEADQRADIWGLGATLYQMLCGVAPFSHIESTADLVVAICSDDVPHLQDRAPWVEAGLAREVHLALLRDPNLRPPTVEDFADRLRRFSGGDELLDEARIIRVSAEMRHRVEGRADLALSVAAPSRPIVMEPLHGVDLSAVLNKEGALEPQVAVRLVLQGASGVAAAHARGVVHRDIKPANLFLQIDEQTEEVTVEVCDFGMPNSPMYMSPEQAKDAKSVDERSDVWSLSVVLWEALSGQRLWGGQTSLGELIVAICTEPIPQLDVVAAWVPHDLARVVHRGLERDPNLRLSSVRAFIESLSVFSGGTDRVQKSQLVAITAAERGALELKVNISASAAAGMANLARGGRGGTSLPPERLGQRRPAKPGPQVANSWTMALLLIIVVGGLSAALGYLFSH